MKVKIVTSIAILILVSQSITQDSEALKQVAGKLSADLKPGETAEFEWGLASDNPDETVTIHLSSDKMGSDFLVYPETIELEPNEVQFVKVKASIPEDFPGGIELAPHLTATEFGEQTGATVMNIRMLKIVTLNVSLNDDSSLWVDWDEILKKEIPETQPGPEAVSSEDEGPGFTIMQQEKQEETMDPEPISELECGPGTELVDGTCQIIKTQEVSGGGCLIATATFGSELAPQVQMLREIRDNTVMSTSSGAAFMTGFNQIYYSFSPTIADLERENPLFKEFVKLTLTPMISSLSILQFAEVDSDFEMLTIGISLIGLNVGMYFVFPITATIAAKKKLQN